MNLNLNPKPPSKVIVSDVFSFFYVGFFWSSYISMVYLSVGVGEGDTRILRGDVLLDCGKSLNPAIDIGQVCICFFFDY
jgi:xanthine dehydrogenase molybdopterin-binding subunit B